MNAEVESTTSCSCSRARRISRSARRRSVTSWQVPNARSSGRRSLARTGARLGPPGRRRRGGARGIRSRTVRHARGREGSRRGRARGHRGVRAGRRAPGWRGCRLVPDDAVGLARPERGPGDLRQPFVEGHLPAPHLRGRLRLLEHPLAPAQRGLGVLHLADVGDQHDEAAHPSGVVAMRDVRRPHDPRAPVFVDHRVVERDLLAPEDPLDVGFNGGPPGITEHLAGVPPQERLAGAVEPPAVAVVDPDVPPVRVEVGDQRRQGVGREPHSLRRHPRRLFPDRGLRHLVRRAGRDLWCFHAGTLPRRTKHRKAKPPGRRRVAPNRAMFERIIRSPAAGGA